MCINRKTLKFKSIVYLIKKTKAVSSKEIVFYGLTCKNVHDACVLAKQLFLNKNEQLMFMYIFSYA